MEVEQGLQVSALPLGRHVEVCQPGLKGLLGGGEGCQVWGPRVTGPFLCSAQLRCLLAQFQALAVLGLRRKRASTQLLPEDPPSSQEPPWPSEPQFPYLQSSSHAQRLTCPIVQDFALELHILLEGSVMLKPGSEALIPHSPLCCVQAILHCLGVP